MTRGERSGFIPPPEPTIAELLAEIRALRADLRRVLEAPETRSADHYHDATAAERRGA